MKDIYADMLVKTDLLQQLLDSDHFKHTDAAQILKNPIPEISFAGRIGKSNIWYHLLLEKLEEVLVYNHADPALNTVPSRLYQAAAQALKDRVFTSIEVGSVQWNRMKSSTAQS
jgi:hypothetical protein